jgi:hypothetical protein
VPVQMFPGSHVQLLSDAFEHVTMLQPEAEGLDLRGRLGAGLGEGVEGPLMIVISVEDEFAAVTSVHDVVDRSGRLDTKRTSHAGERKRQGRDVTPNAHGRKCGAESGGRLF